MGEQIDLNNALTPEQVREAREEYRQVYGDEAFQGVEPQADTPSRPVPAPRVITSADIPRAPYIEPELERTMKPEEVADMRRQFYASQDGSTEPEK